MDKSIVWDEIRRWSALVGGVLQYEKWLTDITEIPCQDGKVYLAPVLDCYDGMIVAFSMADHMRASLCVDAFEQACRKERCRGMLLHSDRGSQYTSREY